MIRKNSDTSLMFKGRTKTNRALKLVLVMMVFLFHTACFKAEPRERDNPEPAGKAEANTEVVLNDQIQYMLERAEIPPEMVRRVVAAAVEGPSFILDLLMVLEGDPYLRLLVDKGHSLPPDYEPADLVELTENSYRVSRPGLLLRRAAAAALEEMAAAARTEGITLTVSSTYRSYAYQEEVYQRNVRELGREAADRESARPGHSQHQTGLAVDFGSIDDSFAQTPAGRWLLSNAGRFGWSLSFPDGYEGVTGYRWESWHYRYVGRELISLIDTYFDGIQQYALRFIDEWERDPHREF
ncbi:MAG: M15 family metallopeptidase [Spirochaetaceae bacterium]|jgi:D-alanyl-D-alanine carboxypeptidase|nr:M15 family metallopeptidase [Spirochaetaceae bacterium]